MNNPKNIVVVATASREAGALTIYRQFLKHLQLYRGINSYYIFIDHEMPAGNIPGVEFIRYSTVKYIDRLRFDYIDCRKLLHDRCVTPDVVISLQNTGVNSYKGIRQIIYYHQSIPFFKHKWCIFQSDERKFFYYKNIYPFFVKKSLGDLTEVVVQTPFVKEGFIDRFHHLESKVHVMRPDVEKVNVDEVEDGYFANGKYNFIYPAGPYAYKRHDSIIHALKLIMYKYPEVAADIKVHFTIKKGSLVKVDRLVDEFGLNNNVEYHGQVPYDEILRMCKSSDCLLFPSEIETLGLPLLEGAAFGLPIIVSNSPYSRDVIDEYQNKIYVDINDYELFADKILYMVRHGVKVDSYQPETLSSWIDFFKLI